MPRQEKTGAAAIEPMEGLKVIALLRERDILDRVQSAFRERQLPEEIFYWFPSSVRAWVDLCRSTEYRNANRALEVLSVAAPELLERLQSARALCGLGCGEGSKDVILLQALGGSAKGFSRYVGADFSQALLELALEEAKRQVPDVYGFKCDLGNPRHLEHVCNAARDDHPSPVIFTVLGNTLGAFEPTQFPSRLRRHLRGNDWFVFDGEIYSEQTLGGYDNPANRRFAWGPLKGVGINPADGRLEFSVAPAGDGLVAVTKHFVATRDLNINVGGEVIEIRSGEMLRMSSSIKYEKESTLLGFVEKAKFKIHSRWRSRDGNFTLACAAPI